MARPVQLRYNDSNNGETVIGTYLKNDNLIKDGMLKNSGSGEYTRLEIQGDKQLKDNIPIDYTQYGDARNNESEPEILVYVRDSTDSNWILRDRVFPEDAGTIKDNGNYRNDNLWGFQKWVGRQRKTGVSEQNSTITDVVDALLPSGYTAVTPAGDTVPTLDNYTFNGKIDRAIRDLVRDFPVKIWFTEELDNNNDYKVKVQSKGFGGVVQTVTFDNERQTAGYQIIEFEEEDKSNIVNKVEVEGVDSNGDSVQKVVSASTSINQHGERYVHRNVGYIESGFQAQNIANDILSPNPSPHAVMSVGFIEENAINASIDITDDRYGIDAVYTIVKQRTFFTDSKTEVELNFEKNRSEERRDRDRELDERNHQLFPTSQTDVGNQSLQTGDALSNTAKTGGVGDSNDRNNDLSNVAKTGGVGDSNDRNNDLSNVAKTGNVNETLRSTTVDDGSSSNSTSLNSSGWKTVATIFNIDNDDALYHTIGFTVTDIDTTSDLIIAIIIDGQAAIYHKTFPSIGSLNSDSLTSALGDDLYLSDSISFVVANESGSSDYSINVATVGNNSPNIDLTLSAEAVKHSHDDDIDTDNNSMGLTDNINTDNQAMGLTDDIDTDDDFHGGGSGDDQHGGSTESNVNVKTSNEEKTDR